jgi:ADP-ribose pyrophosphatase YjhB (NUDIX family)
MTKIPGDATCVFSWVLFDVYQKDVEQFDGKKKTFEWVRWIDAVKAICVVDENILILHEQQPWGIERTSLPWGMVDAWENYLEAIKREIVEETWYIFDSVESLFVVPANMWLVESYRHIFLAKWVVNKVDTTLDSWWEKITVSMMTFEECIERIIADPKFLPWVWDRVVRHYLLPQKKEELRALLFA